MSTVDPLVSYSLDVAFSSATQSLPNNSQNPILAMGFGFAKLKPGEPWHGTGQGTEKVQRNSDVFFSVYDTAPDPVPVTLITLDFPGPSPFVTSEGKSGTSIPVTPKGSQPGQSVGCNVVGLAWIVGPFVVSDNIKDNTTYDITVSVTLADGRVFRVDPEIIVEGGG